MYLVTGATGHIGNVLVRHLLHQGQRVRAMVFPGEDTLPLAGLEVETVTADVLDISSLLQAFQGIQGVFHLAGLISILPGHDPKVWRTNVEGTRNVIEAVRKAGVGRLVYTSSIHAIRRVPLGTTIDESLPFDPDNPYGVYDRSKAQASLEVLQAAREGLDAVLVCPTGVIGPFDFRRSRMGALIREAVERKPQLYVDGAYDFVDVRDVAAGLVQAAERGRSGEAYILSGQRISVRYLLETVREVSGRAFTSIKIPSNLARLVARLTPLFYNSSQPEPRFTPYSLEVLESNSVISHARATRELGYQPRSMYECIRDTVRWWLDTRIQFAEI